MKKLISLLAALAVVSTASVAFAAETETSYGTVDATNATALTANDDGSYTVSDSAADQGTILAVQGTSIKVGSIQYINQATASNGSASFNFKLNDSRIAKTNGVANDDVYVLTGDGKVKVIDLTPEASKGYTISGSVTNFVSQSFIDDELVPYIEEVFEGDDDSIASYTEAYVAGYATRVRLYNKADWADTISADYLAYYEEGGEAPKAVATATVDTTSGTYTLSNIANGDYVLVIERDGALPYFKYVTVADANVTIDAVELALGDISPDYNVDFTDVSTVLSNMADLGDDSYKAGNDTNIDLAVDYTDVSTIIANMTDIWSYDESAIDDTVE